VWLKLLQRLFRIVDEREASALATTILCPEAEDGDLVFLGLVEFGELDTEFVLGDIGAVRVKDITRFEALNHALRATLFNKTHTTICFRARRGLRMNLRVRSVTGASDIVIEWCERQDSVVAD